MESGRAILALDLATKTGWAAISPGWGRPEHGVQDFSLHRGDSPGMRYVRFRAWLEALAGGLRPGVIVYEQAHMRGGAATEIAIGLATRAQEVAAQIGAEHAAVHTATLKKHATGNGRAGKAEMIAAARTRWHVEPADDNAADALCLLSYWLDRYGGQAA